MKLHVFSCSPTRIILHLVAVAALVCALAVGCGGPDSSSDNEGTDGYADLAITAPEDGAFLDHRTVTIQGTAEDPSAVDVEGESVSVDDGQWETQITFEDDGQKEVTVAYGSSEESVSFTVDTMRPDLVIESPHRGTVVDADEAQLDGWFTVSGHVADPGPSGLRFLEINGNLYEADDDDHFEEEIRIDVGLNLVTVAATDWAGNKTESTHGLIYGPLTDPGEPIDKVASLDISDPSGISALTDVIEAYITPEQIEEFIIAAAEEQDTISIEVTSFDWDDLELNLEPTDDGVLDMELVITDLMVEGEFDSDDEDPVQGFIEVGTTTVDLDLEISADDDNQLHIEVGDGDDDGISLEDVTVNIGGEEPAWLQAAVEIAIAVAFEQFITGLFEDTLYDPDLLTQEVEFLGRPIEFTLLLQDVIITRHGILIELGLEFPGERYADVPDVAGALNRPVEDPSIGSVDRPLLFHTTRTAFDRIFHSIWETGLFHQRLGDDETSDIALPIDLTADGLGSLLDSQIRDIHETDTPAELGLRPLLAPVVSFDAEEETVHAQIGDFMLDFYLRPDSQTETLILSVALHLDVEITFEIDESEIDFDVDIEAVADVDDQPIITYDREDTTELIIDLIEVAPQLVASDLSIDSEGSLEWATIKDPEILIHGTDDDQLTGGIDLEPAEDFIEDDDVDPDSGD